MAATQKKHGTSSLPSRKRLQTETTITNGEGQQPPDLPMVPHDGLSNPLTLLVYAHTQPVGHGDVLPMYKCLQMEMTSNNGVGQQYPDPPMVPCDELANPPALPVHTCTQPVGIPSILTVNLLTSKRMHLMNDTYLFLLTCAYIIGNIM